jgi:adenylate cyclase
MALGYGLMLMYRYAVADQQKARIRRLFSLYLAPGVVEDMIASDRLPQLGGEMREVTVWFSDLANFTALSEGLSPEELVSLMNRYFSAVTDIIEAHGGFVDKYIGDAVVAVFGAPHADPHHAGHAVAAALTAQARLAQMNAAGAFGRRSIETRTGINTGLALVGNVGSPRRFNYTVMGDTVNLASRLEGANKALGTRILLSGEAAAQLPPSIVVREVGMIRVKGRRAPVRVFEPLAMAGRRAARRSARAPHAGAGPGQVHGDVRAARDLAALFATALDHYRSRRFAEAAQALEGCAGDAAAANLLGRVRALEQAPPPQDWDGVDVLKEK